MGGGAGGILDPGGGRRHRLDAQGRHVGDVRLFSVLPMDVVKREGDRLPPAERHPRRPELDVDLRRLRDAGGALPVGVARGKRAQGLPHVRVHRVHQPHPVVAEGGGVGKEERLGEQQVVLFQGTAGDRVTVGLGTWTDSTPCSCSTHRMMS